MLISSPSKYYCLAWNRVYVKSNGRIPCWCDAGEPHTILMADLNTQDFVTQIVNSPQMREMRLKILEQQQHYNSYCDKCCFFQEIGRGRNFRHQDHIPETPHSLFKKVSTATQTMQRVAKNRGWEYGSIANISEIQLEPSFACNLRCPGCLHGWHPEPLKSEEKPYIFPYEWFTSMIDSMVMHSVNLRKFTFVGRGEPTLNKQFPDMIAQARQRMPNTIMSMDTNATQEFKDEYLLLDWINCSIDGSTEEAYNTYRYGGDFFKAIRFMRKAVYQKAIHQSTCKIIWKYILFNTTEDIELLNTAQNMARSLGIDELHFVITAVGSHDGTVTPAKTMNNFDVITDYIKTNPIFHNVLVTLS